MKIHTMIQIKLNQLPRINIHEIRHKTDDLYTNLSLTECNIMADKEYKRQRKIVKKKFQQIMLDFKTLLTNEYVDAFAANEIVVSHIFDTLLTSYNMNPYSKLKHTKSVEKRFKEIFASINTIIGDLSSNYES